jgi:hypothetical protein
MEWLDRRGPHGSKVRLKRVSNLKKYKMNCRGGFISLTYVFLNKFGQFIDGRS